PSGPADASAPAGSSCRPAPAVCDVAERCDGVSVACPAAAYAPATVECRPSTGPCDPTELCTGSSPTCPADVLAQDTDGDGVCDLIDDCPTIPDPLRSTATMTASDEPGGDGVAVSEPARPVRDHEGPGAEPERHAGRLRFVVIGRHGATRCRRLTCRSGGR